MFSAIMEPTGNVLGHELSQFASNIYSASKMYQRNRKLMILILSEIFQYLKSDSKLEKDVKKPREKSPRQSDTKQVW